MTVKLLTEQHLEFLSLTGDCTGSSEYAHVKMPHTWNTCHGSNGPRREKTCLRWFAKNKGTDQPAHSRSLISAFVIPLL